MRQILCLSDRPWSSVPGRTQQLMTRLKDAEILFCSPAASRRDKSWKEPSRKRRPGLTTCTLPPAPSDEMGRGFFFRRERDRTLRFLQARLERHRFREPLLWCAAPFAAEFLDGLDYRGLVYDCFQDWRDCPDPWERELTEAADVVFAASPALARQRAACNPNVALLPYGCNYPMFSKDGLPRPAGLQNVRPVLGFAGTIWSDLDLTPLFHAARGCPGACLVLVGRAEDNPMLPALLEEPNVRWFHFIPPVDLPDWICSFDVCLYLQRRGHSGDDVLSPRIFEYLSAGRPIVAMLRPGAVELFPDVVYGAHSPAEFSLLCAHALEETGTWARDRRRRYGQAAAWSSRAAEVSRILESTGLL
ncbi:MAG: hypothetical protein PUC36_06970 [Clostridiales bacterium]|nr:hypothetical protein [Clostridiales bacterium]